MISKIALVLLLILVISFGLPSFFKKDLPPVKTTSWDIQSIDTMKFSRDLAREKENDTSFDETIDAQVHAIAQTGATHVSIGTPYDDEFTPYLTKWVGAARKYHLHVWFRGNMSGWEQWFEYPEIDRATHMKNIEAFILKNADLFRDGDIFSSCPECENGGPGDPRHTGDVKGHRQFLIDEYRMTQRAFAKIGKDVQSNVNAMNYDVAMLTMDKKTVQQLDGIVVVDHYVQTPEKTISDLKKLASHSGGLIILGEVGAPIPDIHGEMSEKEQNKWVKSLFSQLVHEPHVIGVNYWTGYGASTEIWNSDGTPRPSVATITSYFKYTTTK